MTDSLTRAIEAEATYQERLAEIEAARTEARAQAFAARAAAYRAALADHSQVELARALGVARQVVHQRVTP